MAELNESVGNVTVQCAAAAPRGWSLEPGELLLIERNEQGMTIGCVVVRAGERARLAELVKPFEPAAAG